MMRWRKCRAGVLRGEAAHVCPPPGALDGW